MESLTENSVEKISVYMHKYSGQCNIVGEGRAYIGCGCGHEGDIIPYCAIVVETFNMRYRCPKHEIQHEDTPCGGNSYFTKDSSKACWLPMDNQGELGDMLPTILKMIRVFYSV